MLNREFLQSGISFETCWRNCIGGDVFKDRCGDLKSLTYGSLGV